MLRAFQNGTLLKEYAFDERWLAKSKFDLSIFNAEDLARLVHLSARRYGYMRRKDCWPPEKNSLTLDIDVFFFHPRTRKSMFLYCAFNPVQFLEDDADASRAVATLSEDERRLALKHRREGWDETEYLAKAAGLLAWLKANKEGIRVYNSFIRDSASAWGQHFGGFSTLLETMDAFASEWRSWTLGNFGHGNRTWRRFVAWSRLTYNVELDPLPNKVKAAMEMQESMFRADREAAKKRREEEELLRKQEEREEQEIDWDECFTTYEESRNNYPF